MTKYCFLFWVWCVAISSLSAQVLPGVEDFNELKDTKPVNQQAWDRCGKKIIVSWGTKDIRYSKTNVPALGKVEKKWKTSAWKGERVHEQALIWGGAGCKGITPVVSDLVGPGGSQIPAAAVKANFVRYVMTDELNKGGKGGCGYRPDKTKFDSSLVADMIDVIPVRDLEARNTQPVWVSVQVPLNAKAGVYKGKVKFQTAGVKLPALDIELRVLDKSLPAPKDWAFHLDLWQHPFSVARYYNVPLWSDEHLELMRPLMKILADAGQKVITATLLHAPWGGQTHDKFESMVMRIKKLDGSWSFDYAVFDKWVEYMMSMGIDKQINCFSMIPWKLSFQYFDQASNTLKYLDAKVGTPGYNDYWRAFLKDFATHLKQKGWFEITTIAMDERPMASMQQVIKLVKEADPNYKVALAGNYHKEIEADLYDYCVASGQFFSPEVLAARKATGKVSTVYTCCTEPYPNTFSFSPTAEAVWLPLYASAKGFDGYLRWAYNSWTENPLPDTRFHTWAAGDCYLVYPGGRSSIRMERLVEGIQMFEKIRILRDQYKDQPEKLAALEQALAGFDISVLAKRPAAEMVNAVNAEINKL